MKKEIFELAQFLKAEHEKADILLAERKLPCGKVGDRLQYEYDREPYYQRGERFIGLGMYHHLWWKDEWKEAYKWLVDNGYLIENPDHAFHFKYIPQDPEAYKFLFEGDIPHVPEDKQEFYNKYLNTFDWQVYKRDARLRHDNNTCQICGNRATEVHHLTYENLGKEKMEDLISVCKDCHKKLHRGEIKYDTKNSSNKAIQ